MQEKKTKEEEREEVFRCAEERKTRVYLPTTVSSMLSSSSATKTMKRISFLDCRSSLSHFNKFICRRASNPPIVLVPKEQDNGQQTGDKSSCRQTSGKTHYVLKKKYRYF